MPLLETEQTNKPDFIDATQNAVIDAVNSVSQMIENTTAESIFEPKTHTEPFYGSAEFWVGMAFILVVIALAKPLFKALTNLLIRRREKIKSELYQAASLQDEAQKLLARYERQFLNTQNEVNEIISNAKQELLNLSNQKTQALENELFKKQKEAEKVIDAAIEKARDELNFAVSKKTIEIVKTHIKQNITKSQRSKLIDASISNILKSL